LGLRNSSWNYWKIWIDFREERLPDLLFHITWKVEWLSENGWHSKNGTQALFVQTDVRMRRIYIETLDGFTSDIQATPRALSNSTWGEAWEAGEEFESHNYFDEVSNKTLADLTHNVKIEAYGYTTP
jgi:hypothetical protein